MAQREFLGSELRIKQKGVFNLEEFYKIFTRWFEINGYSVDETEYQDLSLTPEKKLLKIKWYCEKNTDEYIRFVIKPSFLITVGGKVEVEKEGVKTQLITADIEVKINYYLEKDYDEKWSTGTALSRFIRDVYDKYFIPRRLNKLRGVLINNVKAVFADMKDFMNMNRVQ